MKILIECKNKDCQSKGHGPNGKKIIGKAYTPFNRAQFYCFRCGLFTNVYGDLSPNKESLMPEKIENQALRRTLFPDRSLM